jgi:hypothetical protein
MARKPTLVDLLGHPQTRTVMQQLASGVDPRLVAAQFAGEMLARQMADGMGVQLPLPEVRLPQKPGRIDSSDSVIDAEYTIIDVTPKKDR